MRLRRVLCAAGASAVVAGTVLIATMPSAAASQPGPWQPFRSTPTSFAAGEVCSFAEEGVPVADEEMFRDLATYPDGSPQEQEFAGLLTFKYTNFANGKSVVRNETGTALVFYAPDGTITFHGEGHIGLSVHIGNPPSTPAGEWVLTGTFDAVIHPDGTKDFTLEHGTAENLCDTLA
jgi:hypothetical protein